MASPMNEENEEYEEQPVKPIRLAGLISGGGRTLLNLADAIDEGRLHAKIELVIASRPGATGIARLRDRGYEVRIAPPPPRPSPASHRVTPEPPKTNAGLEEAETEAEVGTGTGDGESSSDPSSSMHAVHDTITGWFDEKRIDLVCLAGYLRWLKIEPRYRGRVMNIHPALLPKFGGPGMYGHHVHRAVLAAGETESGCTVHFVDEEYDHGPVILQRTCPVLPDDDPDSLAARVFEQECKAYPEAVELFAQRRLRIVGERVEVVGGTKGGK